MAPFAVLAEPKRRQILDLLRGGELPVGDLVDALGASQPAVSKHLRVLRESGLVTSRIDAQRRLYRVNAAPLREIDAWVAPYRALWTHALDELEAHLDEMSDERPSASGGRRTTTPGGGRGRSARADR